LGEIIDKQNKIMMLKSVKGEKCSSILIYKKTKKHK